MWPLLLTLMGSGAQAYGSGQRASAQGDALDTYRQGTGVYDAGENRDNQWAQAGLRGIQGQYDQSVGDLAAGANAHDRMAAFNQGGDQRGTDIAALLASLGGGAVPSQSGAFNAAQGQEAARTQAFTDPAIASGQTAAGLQALGMHDTQNSGLYAQRTAGQQRSLNSLQQMYGLGAALRAQNRSALQNQYTLASGQAQLAGNGAMLAGGLLSSAGQGLASYNQGQAFNNYMGGAGADGAGAMADVPNPYLSDAATHSWNYR